MPTEREAAYLEALPATDAELAEQWAIAKGGVRGCRSRLTSKGYQFDKDGDEWYVTAEPTHLGGESKDSSDSPDDLGLSDVEPEGEPDESNLSDRQRVIATELQTGATVDELVDELGERRPVVTEHIRDLKRQGWNVYIDETAEHVAIEGDQPLRSSEHKGTRTRKANKWWQRSHNALVREFRSLETPTTTLDAESGNEDWVTVMTDLHAGDIVRDDSGNVIYETAEIPNIIDYITEQSLNLADKHGSNYDTNHVLWEGDFLTNEGIYEGQFEDLDAWLSEQHDVLIEPLVRQLKAFSGRFDNVNVVCQVGNHGKHRASGVSKQANADLILYKSVRNTVAQIQQHSGLLENVNFQIGEATPYKNFDMRGGKLTGHLRHGQHRKPQAETSARKKEWQGTLIDHDFDVAYIGHYHISGRIPWDGPPVIVSPSPKPAGEFVETIGGRMQGDYQGVATCHGVSDDGITGVYPVDTRNYGP